MFIDDAHAIAHNKVILIDDDTVITGSFNFTKAAEERNAENLLILGGQADLAGEYHKNFQKHLAHSTPYVRRAAIPHRLPDAGLHDAKHLGNLARQLP